MSKQKCIFLLKMEKHTGLIMNHNKYDGLGKNKFNKIVSLFSNSVIDDRTRDEILGNMHDKKGTPDTNLSFKDKINMWKLKIDQNNSTFVSTKSNNDAIDSVNKSDNKSKNKPNKTINNNKNIYGTNNDTHNIKSNDDAYDDTEYFDQEPEQIPIPKKDLFSRQKFSKHNA